MGIWLVVWNMTFIFPNSWDDDPIVIIVLITLIIVLVIVG